MDNEVMEPVHNYVDYLSLPNYSGSHLEVQARAQKIKIEALEVTPDNEKEIEGTGGSHSEPEARKEEEKDDWATTGADDSRTEMAPSP